MGKALAMLQRVQDGATANVAPTRASFREFLQQDAKVKSPNGSYGPYSFHGREALIEVVDTLDTILGSTTGEPLKDATLVLAGGAQFGKTILELNLAAYLTGCRHLSVGTYLPDDNLAANIVDAKFRPDVVDQIEWFAGMSQLGKAVNKSGKAVNKKSAFLVTDGTHYAVGMFMGLRRVPTSFSLDVVVRDEEDDIPRDKAKFLSGRLTASALRLQIIVGTQRIHGAGQNKQWEAGSQGVTEFQAAGTDRWLNAEDHWPAVCRMAVDGQPKPTDPRLGFEGEFRDDHGQSWHYDPAAHYYLADPVTGAPLLMFTPRWTHRRPERIRLRKWTYRISQLAIPGIDLAQIVAHWTRAVADGEEMISFCCDRLAKPKSAAQALTPAILDRARNVAPFEFGLPPVQELASRVGGLDMGDRCWFVGRQVGTDARRLFEAHSIAAGDVVSRTLALAARLKLDCLLIDQRPLVNEARTIALALNGLTALEQWPRVPDERSAYLTLPGGLTWDGARGTWRRLRCAVVRFDKKQLGAGIEQGLDVFEENGVTKFVPLIRCNRFETIDRAIRELLTPAENVIEVIDGKVRETPAMLLPNRRPGAPAILETLDAHLLAGSQREKEDKTGELGDYIDGIENHLLLADAYSALAEVIGTHTSTCDGLRSTTGCAWGRSEVTA